MALHEVARQALRPPLRDLRFWIVQALVFLVAILHVVADEERAVPVYGIPNFATVSLFLVPVVYAALNFGLAGSLATALWTLALSLPDLLAIDSPHDRTEDVIQLVIVVSVAVFVGQRVDRERLARRRVETAQEELRAYAGKVLAAQEDERRRIAQEIHDEPLQALIHLARQLEAQPAERELATRIAADLREISQGLRPPALDDLGLGPALRRLAGQLEEHTGAQVSVRVAGTQRLAPELELGVFRIAQEALHNVERHAAARAVSVRLSLEPPEVSLEVRDDGGGFDPALPRRRQTLGLVGMRERADLLGGELDVRSRPGAGTRVRLAVPLR
jgi:signal transduction histidine kinase